MKRIIKWYLRELKKILKILIPAEMIAVPVLYILLRVGFDDSARFLIWLIAGMFLGILLAFVLAYAILCITEVIIFLITGKAIFDEKP